MEKIPWWRDRVIYQIYPRSFSDSNGDGIGDIPGIISKLDYLKDLGIGAIWLSPVYKSPNSDNGYDISDYRDINPEYGTMADMIQLLREANNRDIKIVMDLVINHTSDEHRWFQEGIDPSSPYHDYYIWRPGIVKHGKEYPPNNWQSHFTGSAWTKNPDTGLYYLHLFTSKQPDLNYHNERVIEEVKELMKFWLGLGVAGFRCDVINMIYKSSLQNGKPRIFLLGKEHYLSQGGSHVILKRLHDEVWDPYGAYTVGETVGLDGAKAQAYTEGELTTVFQFDHTSVDQWLLPIFQVKYRPSKMRRTLQKWQGQLDWNTLFFENHDIPRSISRFGDEKRYYLESGKMLATIIMTLRGTPFVYQGQEIGSVNATFASINEMDDVSSVNVYKILRSYHIPHKLAFKMVHGFSRDHARTPMAWSSIDNAGFTTGRPWLRLNEHYHDINVEKASKDENSILHYYKNLIAIRSGSPALKIGTITFKRAPRAVLWFFRESGPERLEIIINLGSIKRRINLTVAGKIVMSNYHHPAGSMLKWLAPYQVLIIRR